jgi:hypothetical protein
MVNFLFDATQTPHIPASQIWEHFGLSASTMQAKSKQIRGLVGMSQRDPEWTLPSRMEKNPLVWMLEVNGGVVDVRSAPRAIQAAGDPRRSVAQRVDPLHPGPVSMALPREGEQGDDLRPLPRRPPALLHLYTARS